MNPQEVFSLDRPSQITTIGIIGGGQLAAMMVEPARRLGLDLIVQTPRLDDPAALLGVEIQPGAVDDAVATAHLAKHCQVITFENEWVDLAALGELAAQGVCFRPSLATIAPLVDKYTQRRFLQAAGLPVPPFAAIAHRSAAATIQTWEDGTPLAWPLVAKTRRQGYDGRGTFVVGDRAALLALVDRMASDGTDSVSLLLEAYVPFERELAVVVARSPSGEVAAYPTLETQQIEQVCRRVLAPAPIAPAQAQAAEAIARSAVSALDGVGVFGVELFATAAGEILINEIAPRVHNSGHLTLDACAVSQFEQHLRSVAGLPLGATALTVPAAAMVNLLGFEVADGCDYGPQRAAIAEIPGTIVHWYGKTSARPGRKLGHVNLLGASQTELAGAIAAVEACWYGSPPRKGQPG